MDIFLHDFEDGNGLVSARKHKNGGGIVADTVTISEDCYVGKDCLVYGNAIIKNGCKLSGNVRVYDYAMVMNGVQLEDDVEVFGNAQVKHGVTIFGDSKMSVSPKVVSGFEHDIIITDNRVIVGCHSFEINDFREHAAAIIKVNGYPTKSAFRIHKIISEIYDLHFDVFSQEDIDEYSTQLG